MDEVDERSGNADRMDVHDHAPGGRDGSGDGASHGGNNTNTRPEPEAGGSGEFYGLGTNQSSASIFEDVEMAHDEVSCVIPSCIV